MSDVSDPSGTILDSGGGPVQATGIDGPLSAASVGQPWRQEKRSGSAEPDQLFLLRVPRWRSRKRVAYSGPVTAREEAHRLLDEVPEDRLTDAIDMLRQWASPEPGDVPRRRFRTTAIFDGEHDHGIEV